MATPHDGVPYDSAPDEFDGSVMVQPMETITVSYGMFADGEIGVWSNADEASSPTLALGMLEQAKGMILDSMVLEGDALGPIYPDDTLDDGEDYDA